MKVSGPSSYLDAYVKIVHGFYAYSTSNRSTFDLPPAFVRQLNEVAVFDRSFFVQTILLAVLYTVVRYLLTWKIFNPLGKRWQLTSENQRKLPECLFRMIVYWLLWMLSYYVAFISGEYNAFYDQDELWRDYRPGMPVTNGIFYIYLSQLAFYVHSIYGTVFMDYKRKDTTVMLFHHLLTLLLIGFSYAIRYHKMGVLVLVLNDISDVLLEFTKLNVYLKDRAGKFFPLNDMLSTVGFIVFTSSWAFNRIYLYPMKVLYTGAYSPLVSAPNFPMPFYLFFNVMLWILQILNFYWFWFMLLFIFRVLKGDMKTVEDVRELDVEEKLQRQLDRRNKDKLN